MARHAGILEAGKRALFHKGVAVANAAGLHPNPNLVGVGIGNGQVDEFKVGPATGNAGQLAWWTSAGGEAEEE